MFWKFLARLAKLRLTVRSMIVLVALVAACLAGWREYRSSSRRAWRRAIHAPKIDRVESLNSHGHPIRPPRHVLIQSVIWPIHNLRIDGLDEWESLEELELAMSDPDFWLREDVYRLVANERALLNRTAAIRLLAPGLKDPDDIVRVNAVRGLEPFIVPGDPLARRFFGMIDDHSPLVRRSAVDSICTVIARLPDPSTPGRDHLIAAVLFRLDDPDASVRAATIEAIESLLAHDARLTEPGPARVTGAAILDALQAKLKDPKRGIRIMAAFVLASHGRGLDAVPMLIELANHAYERKDGPFWGIRWPERSLALLADRSVMAASYFIDGPKNVYATTPMERWRLLAEIASRSPEARSRIERLAIQRHASGFPCDQTQLALILQGIGSRHDVLPELLEGALSPHDDIRRDTIQALQARLAFDSRVLPRLREATRDPSKYRARRAAEALASIESTPASPSWHDGSHED